MSESPQPASKVPASRPRRRLSTRRKLLFTLIVCGMALLVTELASRAALVFIPEPPSPTEQPLQPFSTKPPGTLRVITFGESTVAGFPYPELGFVEQLRYWLPLRVPEQPVELINLALGGLNSNDVLRRLRATLREGSPDLLIVMVGHNEFLDRQISSPRDLWIERAEASAIVRLLRRMLPAAPSGQGQSFFLPDRMYPLEPGSAPFRRREARFMRNIQAVATASREAGVPLYLCTLTANERDWPPAYQKIGWAWNLPEYEQQAQAVLAAIRRSDPDAAEAALTRFAPQRPGDAMHAFLAGRIALLRGRPLDARAALEHARGFDPIPWRVLPEYNAAIRAQAGPGVTVVDIAQTFADHTTDGIPGFEWVADNCHPTLQGHALIAETLIEQMARDGLLGVTAQSAGRDLTCPAEAYAAQFAAQPGNALFRATFSIYTATYCMKPPFFNYDAARTYFQQAEQIQPENWAIPANLGTIALIQKDDAEARTQLTRAVALHNGPLPLDQRGSIPYLKEALETAPEAFRRIVTD